MLASLPTAVFCEEEAFFFSILLQEMIYSSSLTCKGGLESGLLHAEIYKFTMAAIKDFRSGLKKT